MNIWEFRKLVRQRRADLAHSCLLEIGCGSKYLQVACNTLRLPAGYVGGLAAGFDGYDWPRGYYFPAYRQGYLYGQRMALIAERKYRNGINNF